MSSDLERVIKLVFLGDNRTGSAFKAIGADMKSLGKAAGDATQPLADMHDRILLIQAGLGALAVGGLAVSIQAAGEFDTQFREISSLLTDVDVDLDHFKKTILDYATQSSFAFDQTTTAVYEAISRYAEYGDALEFVAISEKLAIAGKAGLVDSTKLLASTMRAYGAEVEEASRYSDVFLKTVQLGGTTLQEVAAVLGRATPLAGELGIEIEDLGAVIATLTAGGMETSQAITGLIGIMNAVIKPSSQATTAAKELDIAFDGAALRSEGLAKFMGKVFDAAEGNDEVITSLFGRIEGLTSALALFGKDGGDAFVETLRHMREAGGTTEEMYARMVDGMDKINQRLVNSIRGMLVSIGIELLDGHKDVVKGLQDIFHSLKQAVEDDAFKAVFDVINEMVAELAKVLNDVARNLPAALADADFSEFAESIRGMVDAVTDLLKKLFGNVDLGTAAGLTSVIQKMADVFTTLNNVTIGIIDAWGPWAERLFKVVDGSTALNSTMEEAIGKFLQFGKLVNVLSGGIGSLGGVITSFDLLIKVFLAGQTLKWIVVFGKMVGAASALTLAAGALAAGLGVLGGALLRDLFPAIDKVTQKWLGFLDSLDPAKLVAINPVLAGVIGLFQKLTSGTRDATDGVQELDRTFHKIPWEKDISIGLKIIEDAGSKDDLDEIRRWLDDPSLLEVDVLVDIDEDKYQETKSKLEEEPVTIPLELQVADVEAKSREAVAQIDATADIVRAKLQWTAELDIAEVQANARILEAAFDSIAATMESTGDTMLGLFALLADADMSTYGELREQILLERNMREEAHNKNMMLLQLQIDESRKRARMMERGDAMISIDGQGLQPHLEAFMWEILSAIQVRVNEEGMDMLLGV